jgi:hypothetical protein
VIPLFQVYLHIIFLSYQASLAYNPKEFLGVITVVTVEDMLGKVPKLRYSSHDVRDMDNFPDLMKENYFADMGEIGPLGRPILDPTQWITWLYNLGIMNLLDIPHLEHGRNVGLFFKQLLAKVHVGILWMDRVVLIDVVLISKITRFPTIGAQTKEYLENKSCEKEIVEIIKA